MLEGIKRGRAQEQGYELASSDRYHLERGELIVDVGALPDDCWGIGICATCRINTNHGRHARVPVNDGVYLALAITPLRDVGIILCAVPDMHVRPGTIPCAIHSGYALIDSRISVAIEREPLQRMVTFIHSKWV